MSDATLAALSPAVKSAPSQKSYLSPSQLESYCRCPEAYRRRYLEKEIIPPGVAMIQGSGLHKGAELNFRQKIKTHVDLPAADIIDAAVAAFDAAASQSYCLSDEEALRGSKAVLGEAKDQLAALAALHAAEVAPEYQPLLVEETVRLELPDSPRDLLGIIDLADDKGRVVDHKVSGKRKSQAEADSSVALTFYAAAHRKATGALPTELRLEVLVKNKRPVRQLLIGHRSPADFRALANRINAVLAAINSGNFPPATPGAWWCSPKFCGYFNAGCPYVNSEREQRAEHADD